MLKKAPKRLAFRESDEIIDLPNLIEVQLKSYNQFLQADSLPNERRQEGLQEVFSEIFPIKSQDEKVVLEFLSYNLGVPKYGPEDCIRRGISYSVNLKVKFRLTDETGIKEEEVYMGTLPLMTDKGTFIINGAERVIVSQLHRSPGITFEKERHSKGVDLHSFRIIPYRGSWFEATFDTSDMVYIYIDRKKRRRKILATTFIRTLGLSTDEDIIAEFFTTQDKKLKTQKDFDQLLGSILAQDVLHNDLTYGRVGEKLTTAMLKRMLDDGVKSVKVALEATENSPIIKMLARDPTDSYETALKDFYRKMRPGELVTLSNARSAMMRLFFDGRRYSLGRVGRYKINTKLSRPVNNEVLENHTLMRDDIIEGVRYLIRLKEGDPACSTDDIDHLINRRVRAVGELIQNQCRVGLARMEKIIRERMNLFDFTSDTMTPGKIVSAKGLVGVLKDFFGRSQLSQFMDQANPISELTHKRRLSALGPGGLNRDRAGFEVRDVHTSHYGRICPTETPEGPNIGLITSLSSYAKINEFGFIETPYRVVKEGLITDEVEYMTAGAEEQAVIAQSNVARDQFGLIQGDLVWARTKGDLFEVPASSISHVDVSPKQLVSIVTGLIPFLEHDDANRALMGSNMQRQAVPLLIPEAPIVGTGLEGRAAKDSGAVVVAREAGNVDYVDGYKVVVSPDNHPLDKRTYNLKKFLRSNSGTSISQQPICQVGDRVRPGDVLADGSATDKGEIALGKNVLVAFMSWCGYNYEDAIIISEKLLKNDTYTSIYIEEFEVTARDTKLGREEITCDIPNVREDALANLGEDGIIRIGSEVKPGDILVGKITPKSETELAPEERLLRAIFGEKAADVKDASLLVPPGTEGVVMDVKVFSRRDRLSSNDDDLVEEAARLREIQQSYKDKVLELKQNFFEKVGALLLGEHCPGAIILRRSSDILIHEGALINEEMIEELLTYEIDDLLFPSLTVFSKLKELFLEHAHAMQTEENHKQTQLEQIRKGDTELDAGVVRQVKVYIASKRKLQVGDKMAGRHGNKGIVAKIVPEEDMPYLPTGESVEIILNPLGVPSRMNIGQLLETHLGWAAAHQGIHVKTPVFEGFPEEEIWKMMDEAGLREDGKALLINGMTGERFDNPVVVGYIYMLKLSHLVADKIHARAVGPYSLVTQQPLGGKAQKGGQRFGEMEVWALEAYGAAHLLQEMLTVKSDDVSGRTKIYESIVKGENTLSAGIPESFNVLLKEMQGLGLDVRLESLDS